MCVDYDEMEIARWLLDQGMDPNVPAAIGANGFGGYTPLFATVVSQPNFWMNYNKRGPFEAPFTQLLLERGANPNIRASIWKRLHPGHGDPARHDYRDVTALSWGRRFHAPIFVSEPAMRLIADAGGME
jgi:ankyrin repeat protein